MEEVWKTLVYHGDVFSADFEVSTLGRIRNRATGTVYRLHVNRKGYAQVCLAKGRKAKLVVRAHRAVAETFLPCRRDGDVVNHKDGNKLNNRLDNLEWCTPSENTRHAYRTGLMPPDINRGEKNGNTTFTKDQVAEIRSLYVPRDAEFGTRGLARRYGVDHMTISRIIRGQTWA